MHRDTEFAKRKANFNIAARGLGEIIAVVKQVKNAICVVLTFHLFALFVYVEWFSIIMHEHNKF